MPFTRAGQLARSTTTARLTDPLGLVAENLRTIAHGVLPVLDRPSYGRDDPAERGARVIGLITLSDLARVTGVLVRQPGAAVPVPGPFGTNGHGANGHSGSNGFHVNGSHPLSSADAAVGPFQNPAAPAGRSLPSLTARDVMRADVPFVPDVFTLENTLLTLDRYGLDALPVVSGVGGYLGVVTRADVISAMYGAVRPPSVGGMATPFGVYLTDGRLSGGVEKWALAVSGVVMAFGYELADRLPPLLLSALNPRWAMMWNSGQLAAANDPTSLFNLGATAVGLLIFLLFIRLQPLAGYHAAEHQTVWAMERGLPLEPEFVGKMPRPHPRCGTNLVALGIMISIMVDHLPDPSSGNIIIVLLFTFFFWRSFGGFLQEYFTTRPASRKQLESGIRAGKQLMERYQQEPSMGAPLPLMLLNSGIFFTVIGVWATMTALDSGFNLAARWMAAH